MESLWYANTKQFMHFRETNTELSMDLRKANMDFFLPVLLKLKLYSQFHFQLYLFLLPVLIPCNITTNLLHYDKCNVICVSYIGFFSAAT